jgi:predicted metal-dependent peptidase
MNPAQEIDRKLQRARVRLLLSQPFFGSLCLRLKLASAEVSTMATDGQRIFYDPGFVQRLTAEELEGTLAHEVLHCALGHHCRRGQRDPALWNQAADLAINPLLLKNGFTLPAGALIEQAFHELGAEEIYARLLERRQKEEAKGSTPPSAKPTSADEPGATTGSQAQCPADAGLGSSSPTPITGQPRSGGFGEVLDAQEQNGEAASAAETSRQQKEWAIAAEQAVRSARSCGREPAGISRPLVESRRSRQDWRAILREFICAGAPSDYRWSPPNRRYIARGLYLPSVERSSLGEIVVAIDTSGSVRRNQIEQFAGEIEAIAEQAQPEGIHVVYCDARVQSWERFAPGEAIELHPRGRGGTDFRPVFAWVGEQHLAPACLVYLTDLCCNSFPEPPEYPVLWVTGSERKAPFGETVRLEDE